MVLVHFYFSVLTTGKEGRNKLMLSRLGKYFFRACCLETAGWLFRCGKRGMSTCMSVSLTPSCHCLKRLPAPQVHAVGVLLINAGRAVLSTRIPKVTKRTYCLGCRCRLSSLCLSFPTKGPACLLACCQVAFLDNLRDIFIHQKLC